MKRIATTGRVAVAMAAILVAAACSSSKAKSGSAAPGDANFVPPTIAMAQSLGAN